MHCQVIEILLWGTRRCFPNKSLTAAEILDQPKQQGEIHRRKMQSQPKDSGRLAPLLSSIPEQGRDIEKALSREQDGEGRVWQRQHATNKPHDQKNRREPAKNSV